MANWWKHNTRVWIPPVLLVLLWLFRQPVVYVANFIGDNILFCLFHETTGLYCLGCGCTRSVMALLHGDFRTAAHNNLVPFVGILVLLLWYIEQCAAALGRPIRLYPRKLWFWLFLFGLQFIWNIFRNLIPSMAPITVNY